MAKIYIVEDNKDQLAVLEEKLSVLGHLIVGKSTKAINVLSEVKESNPDIIILDINLSDDNEGIVLAERIRKNLDVSIIFISALTADEVIKNAIANAPASYLVKPVKIEDLKAAIILAMRKEDHKVIKKNSFNDPQGYLTVRIGHKLKKINFESIIMIETESKNYVTLLTNDHTKVAVRSSLKTINTTILPHFFIQVHRKYIVNINFIQYVNENEQMVQLKESRCLPIGKAFKKELYGKLNLI